MSHRKITIEGNGVAITYDREMVAIFILPSFMLTFHIYLQPALFMSAVI